MGNVHTSNKRLPVIFITGILIQTLYSSSTDWRQVRIIELQGLYRGFLDGDLKIDSINLDIQLPNYIAVSKCLHMLDG